MPAKKSAATKCFVRISPGKISVLMATMSVSPLRLFVTGFRQTQNRSVLCMAHRAWLQDRLHFADSFLPCVGKTGYELPSLRS